MNYYTYAYLRQDGTPYYIGKGKGNRIYQKSGDVIKPPKNKNRIIFLKQNLTEDNAFKHEIYMISIFGRKDLNTGILHNRTNGGEGASGHIQSEETKQKRSIALKGKSRPQEVKEKIGNKNRGKTHSEETRQKISDIHKGNTYWVGKKHSEESKKKMRDAKIGGTSHMSGKIHSEETRQKISASKKGKSNGCVGRKYSPETIEKMRQSALNRKNKELKTLVENLEAL